MSLKTAHRPENMLLLSSLSKRRSKAVVGFLLFCLGYPLAVAKGQETIPADEAQVSQNENDEEKEALEEIVITGSLIKRTNMTTPIPTTILDADLIEMSGEINIIDTLNELPAMATGNTQQTANYSFGNAGLSQLNLRNMGTNRTLVLVDGRRPVGTPDDANFLSFDFNSMPIQLIERVEVITGGASATYGSDAVTGVVNVITKKNFEGTEFGFSSGISSRGDSEQTSLSFITGHNLHNNRGNAMVFFRFSENKGLWQRDRSFMKSRYRYVVNPDNTGPEDGIANFIAADDVRWTDFNLPGTTTYLPVNSNMERDDNQENYVIFDENGNPRLFEYGPSGDLGNGQTDGGDAGYPGEYNRALVPLRVYNFGARYTLDVTDTIRFNLDGRYARTESRDTIDAGFAYYEWGRDYVSINNPYITDSLRTIMLGDPVDPADDINYLGFIRTHREYGPRITDIARQFFAISAGLEGSIGDSWEWNAYYQAGGTTTNLYKRNDQLDARFSQAVDSVVDPVSSEIVCRDPSNGCVPINPFVPNGISPEAVDFITTNHNSKYLSQQQIFTAFLTGDSSEWFEMPAGALGMAAGVEARQEKLGFEPSGIWQEAMGFYASEFQPISGTINVKEVFAEVLVPILNDLPVIEYLSLESAIRFADYNFGGSNWSWKIGGDWAPLPDIRFRSVYAQSVRAPGLSELFNPGSRGAMGLDDPCDVDYIDLKSNRVANCAALGVPVDYQEPNMTTLVYSSGNEALDAETAKTLTAGMVITPRWIPSLSIAVDYWDIDMTQAIARFGAQNILDNCVDSPSINNDFCELIDRNPETHDVVEVRDTYVNADRMKVQGIDFEVDYEFDLDSVLTLNERASIRLRGVITRLLKWNYHTAPETRTEEDEEDDFIDKDAGEAGDPKWRGSMGVTFRYATLSVNWQTRFVAGQVTDVQVDAEDYDPYTIPSIFYHDLHLSYTLEDFPALEQKVQIYAGINNVFDTVPPHHPYASNGWYSFYDRTLRYFYAGAKIIF